MYSDVTGEDPKNLKRAAIPFLRPLERGCDRTWNKNVDSWNKNIDSFLNLHMHEGGMRYFSRNMDKFALEFLEIHIERARTGSSRSFGIFLESTPIGVLRFHSKQNCK